MTETIESSSVELDTVDRTLLGVTDPEQGLIAAERFAQALKERIDAGGLAHRIGNKDYLGLEALQMAATALGIVGLVVWTHPLPDDGWEARAEARRMSDQALLGAGEGMCSRDEPKWARRLPFERRAVAQSRALVRALRGPVGSVVSLASYAVTPIEEMDGRTAEPELPAWAKPTTDIAAVADALIDILKAADVPEPAERTKTIGQLVRETCDGAVPVIVRAVLEAVQAAIEAANKKVA